MAHQKPVLAVDNSQELTISNKPAASATKNNHAVGSKVTITPKNKTQAEHLQAMLNADNAYVVSRGEAGSGRTFLSVAVAVAMLRNHHSKIERIIFTRAPVECGPSLGYAPGEIDEKMAHYAKPLHTSIKVLEDYGLKLTAEERKLIKVEPLGHVRGDSWHNAIVIVDEAQNLTENEIMALLTRVGENSQVFINGDSNQQDRKMLAGTSSGLNVLFDDLREELKEIPAEGGDEFCFIQYPAGSSVRSAAVKRVLEAHRRVRHNREKNHN